MAPAAAEPLPESGLPVPIRRPLLNRLASPAGIGWSAAALVAAALAVFVFVDTGESTADPAVVPATTDETQQQPAIEQASGAGDDKANPEVRLTLLGEWIAQYRNDRGHFPAALGHDSGLGSNERLSWLAALAIAQDELSKAQPQEDRAWHDPLNDRFVRQRVLEFQNPLVEEVVGAQGYPASHFVGIAGVGADAPGLPKEHARAGIFGDDRLTIVEDVADGLSNTMMVAGVEQDLTSWAAHGQGTLRALTAEPYLHGPDGLGTGQPDGMFVLMADGSVRFLAAATDPRLLRRMAAMHDGLPLDPAVPGEPGEAPSAAPEPVVAAPVEPPPEAIPLDPAEDEPIGVLLSPDEARFDVEGALAVRVLRFTQSEPVPAFVLLQQLEELGGVPIDRSEIAASPAADQLQKTISISLSETTFGEILRAVLAELEMSFTAGPRGITLHPSPP